MGPGYMITFVMILAILVVGVFALILLESWFILPFLVLALTAWITRFCVLYRTSQRK